MAGDLKKATTYMVRPEISEIFADGLEQAVVDGGVVRFEFSINRFDHPQPPKAPGSKRYTACRLVLSMAAAVDLYNRLNQLIEIMKKQGAVTANAPIQSPTRTMQ